MGKSFKHEKNQYSEHRVNKNEFKRKKNQVKENNEHEEFSEYKIHGLKNKL